VPANLYNLTDASTALVGGYQTLQRSMGVVYTTRVLALLPPSFRFGSPPSDVNLVRAYSSFDLLAEESHQPSVHDEVYDTQLAFMSGLNRHTVGVRSLVFFATCPGGQRYLQVGLGMGAYYLPIRVLFGHLNLPVVLQLEGPEPVHGRGVTARLLLRTRYASVSLNA
jgi:hypothetical protein